MFEKIKDAMTLPPSIFLLPVHVCYPVLPVARRSLPLPHDVRLHSGCGVSAGRVTDGSSEQLQDKRHIFNLFIFVKRTSTKWIWMDCVICWFER
jgi:hypothetical protein